MTGWQEFALALGAFMLSHLVPRIGGLRDRLIQAMGRRVYFALYGALSLALLAWVIVAAGRAPYVALWDQAAWTRWAPFLLTPFVFVLTTCGIGSPLPDSLGGSRKRTFDPGQPGFAAISRHPLLLALALWAGAHVLPNGDLAHVVLFGLFAAFPLLAIWAFDRRAMKTYSAQQLQSAPILSLRPLLNADWWRSNTRPVLIRTAIGLVLWAGALHLHGPVIGVWPFPH